MSHSRLHITLSKASTSPSAPTIVKPMSTMNHTAIDTFHSGSALELNHRDQATLKLKNIDKKKHLIDNSQQKETQQRNEVKRQVDFNDDEQTPKRKQTTETEQSQTLCFDKKLADNNQSTHRVKQTNNESTHRQSPFAPSTETQISATTLSLTTDETINILLLGESGVGKSTFINAFVNYLTYETLSEAESKQPVVLMPVSFIMTTGHNFTEQIVQLDVPDTLSNEDFRHPGQSATQRCRSYLFHLKHHDGKKLRIIDTPGFGDTRGLNQDDLSMQHILEYINNLTHLNAVCFLLKPNSTRIHLFFRLCLAQLLDFLGPNVRQNIIFCFTNSRATFYTPGDTAPLLKTILKSLSLADILFQKQNTFCFDSESFRYLLALKNQISFNNEEQCDYAASWCRSATEFNRFLNYVCQNRTVYRMHDDWQSIRHAQLEIIQMVRPMVEAMRNILRNIILCERDSTKKSIEICAKPICQPIIICLSCKHELIQIANFWLLPDCQHNIQENSHNCSDASNQHLVLNYILDHNIASDRSTIQKDELSNQVSLLHDASAMFSNFLMHTAIIPKDDLFLAGLTRMLHEEKYICTQKGGNYPNRRLSEDLQLLIHKYTFRLRELQVKKECTKLSTIYSLIKIIRATPDVRTQLIAVKIGQEDMMERYEYKVPNEAKNVSSDQSLSF